MAGKTLYHKIWDRHVVYEEPDQPALLYIDLHLIHEVTSPQAFEGLRMAGRGVRRPDLTLATMDHNVPTIDRDKPITDRISAKQMATLEENCKAFGIELYGLHHPRQGIVHVIAPELGVSQPGKTVVCGDSHTSTHGAFGALGFGIGTSEVEHVLATQCLPQSRSKTLAIEVDGQLAPGVTAKDIILALIGQIGTAGGTGYVMEYRGAAIRALGMEQRMTICNMSIEAGARAGMIAPDDATYAYMEGRAYVPKGREWEKALEDWQSLPTDDDAVFDRTITLNASELSPQVTWGTNPGMVAPVTGKVPDPEDFTTREGKRAAARALEYMDLKPGTALEDIRIDRVFIGSCTNARLSDLREAARMVAGHHVADGVRALVVPGSQAVKRSAEVEGLDQVFLSAGFEWRESGCSMCLGMNADILQPGERCASTSNRNFEGRQGRGGRTHLVSPVMAAAAAITGHFVDVRSSDWASQ